MQVSYVEKNMVEQSSTDPNSQSLNHTLGLTLSTPGLVLFIFQSIVTIKGQMYFDGKIRI